MTSSKPRWIRSDRKAARPDAQNITVDDQAVAAYPGEMLAVALRAAGVARFRDSAGRGEPRGPFCLMGVCQDCLVRVDGQRVLACRATVRAGMCVTTLAAPR